MKQLLILSGKGGTGKTTVATAFIKLLNAKAYADCDVDAPNLHLLMQPQEDMKRRDFYGMDKAKIDPELCNACGLCYDVCRFEAIVNHPIYHVAPFACEGCGVCSLVCPTKAIEMHHAVAGDLMLYSGNIVFSTAKLRMGSGTSGLLVSDVKKQMKTAAENVDVAIIDGSPGIGCPVIASISGVDLILIVSEPSISGISDLKRIIEVASKFNTPVAVCVNKADTNSDLSVSIERYCTDLRLPFVGLIPFDPKAVHAINNGQSIVDVDCEAGSAVTKVYQNTMVIFDSVGSISIQGEDHE